METFFLALPDFVRLMKASTRSSETDDTERACTVNGRPAVGLRQELPRCARVILPAAKQIALLQLGLNFCFLPCCWMSVHSETSAWRLPNRLVSDAAAADWEGAGAAPAGQQTGRGGGKKKG
jgi:hypothetical protein